MERSVLITRPKIDAIEIAEEIRQKGHQVLCEPLIDISYHQESFSLSKTDYAGLVFTSVNGVRAFCQNCDNRDLPVYTVGDKTMKEVQQARFHQVQSASGTVDDLVYLLSQKPSDKPYLYIRGEYISKPLKGSVKGVRIEEKTLYHTEKKEEISLECLEAINSGQLTDVLFFSKRTAESFVDYIVKQGLESALKSSKALCLGASMIEYVSVLPWQDIQVAKHPDQAGIIALLDE